MNAINADIEKVDGQIKELIEKDPHLKELFDCITSVPGVGAVTASEVIVATNEFNAISDPKKLAASAVRLSRRSSSIPAPIGQYCKRKNGG